MQKCAVILLARDFCAAILFQLLFYDRFSGFVTLLNYSELSDQIV